MKYSEITLEDKNWETLDLIHSFSQSVIKDFDEYFKNQKPLPEETPFIDLQVEAYFSINAFCTLMKDGLVSSACAILRVIIEQVSIVSLLTHNKQARKAFFEIKKGKAKYYSANSEQRKLIRKELIKNKRIPGNKVKQYFDYGWCKEVGCTSMELKSICQAVGVSIIYETIESFLNQFAHGQMSIFQFRRSKNGVDKKFRTQILQEFFQMYSLHTQSMFKLYGFQMFSVDNRKLFSLSTALCFDIRTRLSEDNMNNAIKEGKVSLKDLRQFIEVKNSTTYLLNETKDDREMYFLSQAFIRMTRQALVTHVYLQHKNIFPEDFKMNNLFSLFNKYNLKVDGYKGNGIIPLDTLLKMIDSFDDNHAFNDSDIDYAFVYSINSLLTIIQNSYNS